MAAGNEGQERTERASPRKLQQAREKGQIPRSRELNTAAVVLAAAGGLLLLGGPTLAGLKQVMRRGLSVERPQVFNELALVQSLGERMLDGLLAITPLLVLLVLVALAAPLLIGGWAFNAGAFAFQTSRLNPVEGMKRVFSARGLVELVKALAKFAVVVTVAGVILWHFTPELVVLGQPAVGQGLARAADILGWSLLALAGSLLLIAAVDVPFQIWDHGRQLRMTRQEVRDEFKETEGSPEVKGRLRRLQQEVARRRMMAEVPKADVVVTNPTHYAVALKYDQAKRRAPIVVAKGRELVASEIRRLAAEARVPLVSAPPLARALYYSTELDHEIPQGLYLAVAKLLAYVYQLRHSAQYVAPPRPEDLSVPPEFARS